jgi:uncharacterized membrane protein
MKNTSTAWMQQVLRLAAIYNLVYGAALAIAPQTIFNWLEMPHTPTPMIQCIGMMVGVYALGYGLASRDPLGLWPLILVGFVGQALGVIGFTVSYLLGSLPLKAGLMNLTNDLIWLPFFSLILWRAWIVEKTKFESK